MNNHAAKTMCTTFVDLNYLIVQNEFDTHFIDNIDLPNPTLYTYTECPTDNV